MSFEESIKQKPPRDMKTLGGFGLVPLDSLRIALSRRLIRFLPDGGR
jgi:hypothetical protein